MRVLGLVEGCAELVVHALTAVLGDHMLDDDLDRPQRHVAERDVGLRAASPLCGRKRLQEVFDDPQQGDGIKDVVAEVVFDAPSAFPDALEDQLGVLCLPRGGQGSLVDKVDCDPLEKDKQSTEKWQGRLQSVLWPLSDGERTHPKMISRLPPLKILRMIMLRKRDNSFASVRRSSNMI